MFEKAVLMNVKAKVVIAGPSGSGKTFSSLRLASGLANGGKIGMIDTEGDRGLYYANKFEYFRDTLKNHSPEAYMGKIKEAKEAGVDVLIIDSITHEWKQLLEDLEKIPGSNQYAKWGQITPRHEKFLKTILETDMHIICTVRAKDKYILETNDKGKQAPKKVGLGLEQRDTLEYEFTTVIHTDSENHFATAGKDNTGIFKGLNELLSEKHGENLLLWCSEGIDPEEQEIGIQNANLLEDFMAKKKIPEEQARDFIKLVYDASDFRYLKKKDCRDFNDRLKKCNFDIASITA